MAKIFPDCNKVLVKFSHISEEELYHKLRTCLSDDHWVLYGIRINSARKSLESDFIVLNPQGKVLVLDLKSGNLNFSDGKFTRPGGQPVKHPISDQAMPYAHTLHKIIQTELGHNICFHYGAILSDVSTADIAKLGLREDKSLYLGSEDLQPERLKTYIARRFRDMGEKSPVPPEKIADFLKGPSFSSDLKLRQYIDAGGRSLVKSHSAVISRIEEIFSHPFTIVRGEAGTGKTWLAIMGTKHLCTHDMQKKVLFLGYNNLLNELVTEILSDFKKVDVLTIDQIFDRLSLPVKFGQGKIEEEHKRALHGFFERYDAIVVDECQDLMQPPEFFYDSLVSLRARSNYNLYCFLDENQIVFGSHEKPEEVLDIIFSDAHLLSLNYNYRNTRAIYKLANQFLGKPTQSNLFFDRGGYTPQLIGYKPLASDSGKDFCKRLGKLLHELIHMGNVDPSEIIVLSPIRFDNPNSALFYSKGNLDSFQLVDISHANQKLKGNQIHFCTSKAFKGLEKEIVIHINICHHKADLNTGFFKKEIYVGFSRAQHMLYIFSEIDHPKTEILSEMITAVHKSNNGTLVIDTPIPHTATLISINSRFGMITIDDLGSDEKYLIFPQDLKKITASNLHVGSRYQIELKHEDQQVYALPLKSVS